MTHLPARLVYSKTALSHAGAGAFAYAGHANTEHAGIVFNCPCGCGTIAVLPFLAVQLNQPTWGWDGNVEHPTLRPSIFLSRSCLWHGALDEGIWKRGFVPPEERISFGELPAATGKSKRFGR